MTTTTTSKEQAFWNDFADVWNNSACHAKALAPLHAMMAQRMHLQSARRLLEVGAGGGGQAAREFLRHSGESGQMQIVTSDFAEAMVERLREALKDERRVERVEQIDARSLPFEDAEFDRYYAGCCIHLVFVLR